MLGKEFTSNGNPLPIKVRTQLGGANDVADLSASARLRFAKQILLGLALISTMVFIGYGIAPDNRAMAAMFEFIKIGALPLVTLVVSFYFPNKPQR